MIIYTVYGIEVPQKDLEIYKNERNCSCPIVNASFEFCPHCGSKMWSQKRIGYVFDEKTRKWGNYDVIPIYHNRMCFIGVVLGSLDTKNGCCYIRKQPNRDEIAILTTAQNEIADKFPDKVPHLYSFATE